MVSPTFRFFTIVGELYLNGLVASNLSGNVGVKLSPVCDIASLKQNVVNRFSNKILTKSNF